MTGIRERRLSSAECQGLDRLSLDDGKLLVVAADQRSSLRRMRAAAGAKSGDDQLRDFKRDVVRCLSPHASGVLLDPELAFPDLVDDGSVDAHAGVLVALEQTDPPWIGGLRRSVLLPGVDPVGLSALGVAAAKLLVYLRPDQEDGDRRACELVTGASRACAAAGLCLVVEVLVYALPGEDPSAYRDSFSRLIRDAAVRSVDAGARFLKLPFPGSEAACHEITDSVGVPWVVLSGGTSHEVFVGNLEQALDGGASGCMAGRSIWGDAVGMADPVRRAWLEDEGVRRVEELARRMEGRGRPWCEVDSGR
ncbi:MAG: tagatose-bisphosphate aldolase [Acidimicrobiales bacterium]